MYLSHDEILAGSHIDDVAEMMVELANYSRKTVYAWFNGIGLIASFDPPTTARGISKTYDAQLKATANIERIDV